MAEEVYKGRATENEAPLNSTARRGGFWKNIFFGTVVVTLFFGGLELGLALVGVRPVLSTEDPFVGFAENIPLFVEEHQARRSRSSDFLSPAAHCPRAAEAPDP